MQTILYKDALNLRDVLRIFLEHLSDVCVMRIATET